MKLLEAMNIEYSHSQQDATLHHMVCFYYTSMPLADTLEVMRQFIYCHNRPDFLELLNYWNRDDKWKYVEVK